MSVSSSVHVHEAIVALVLNAVVAVPGTALGGLAWDSAVRGVNDTAEVGLAVLVAHWGLVSRVSDAVGVDDLELLTHVLLAAVRVVAGGLVVQGHLAGNSSVLGVGNSAEHWFAILVTLRSLTATVSAKVLLLLHLGLVVSSEVLLLLHVGLAKLP